MRVPQRLLGQGLIVVIFLCVCVQTCGFRGIQMAHALLRSQEKTVVFVFTGLSFFNYGPQHQRGPLRSNGMRGPEERWSGTALVLILLLQVWTVRARWKPLLAARWLAAGPRVLVRSSSSTRYSFFFPPSASLSEKYVPCGLVGAVK